MAISPVQHASGTSASNTVTVTLAATGAGNALLVVATYLSGTDSDLSGITLGGSSSGWASQLYGVGTDAPDVTFWANFSIAAGQTSLVVTLPSADAVTGLTVDAYEVSGGLVALDQWEYQEVDGTSGSWTSGASAVTTSPAEFILGCVTGYNNAAAALTFTGPAGPWVNETQLALGSYSGSLSGYQVAASEAAFTYSGTANTTGTNLYYLAVVTTWRASAATTGPAFRPANRALQAKRQRLPQQGRVRSNPGGPPSTHNIATSGRLTFSFGLLGYSYSSLGLMVTTQAEVVLNAILLQQGFATTTTLNLRLGSTAPTASIPMIEITGFSGYEPGGFPCAFNAASAGTATNSTAISCTNAGPGAWDIFGIELWDPGEGTPVRWLFGDWSGYPITVAVGNTFVITSASLEISMS